MKNMVKGEIPDDLYILCSACQCGDRIGSNSDISTTLLSLPPILPLSMFGVETPRAWNSVELDTSSIQWQPPAPRSWCIVEDQFEHRSAELHAPPASLDIRS